MEVDVATDDISKSSVTRNDYEILVVNQTP